MGIKSETIWCASWCSNPLSHTGHGPLPFKINVISSKCRGAWSSLSLTSLSPCQFWDLSQENNSFSIMDQGEGTPTAASWIITLFKKLSSAVCKFPLGNIILRHTAIPLPVLRFGLLPRCYRASKMGHQQLYWSHKRKFGQGSRSCCVCSNRHGLSQKYGLNMCCQCFCQ